LFIGWIPFVPTVDGVISLLGIFFWVFNLRDGVSGVRNFFVVDNGVVEAWGNDGWWGVNFSVIESPEVFEGG